MSKKAPKFEALVVNAIRRLQSAQGSTASEIAGYLAQEYDVAGPEVRRQIQLTIRRGVNYGILQKLKRGYITCDRNVPEPLDRSSIGECYSRRSSRRHHGRRRRSGRSRRSRHRRGKSRGRSSRRRGGRKRGGSRRGRRMAISRRAARSPRKRATANEEQKAANQSGQETPTSQRLIGSPPSRGRSNSKSPTRNP